MILKFKNAQILTDADSEIIKGELVVKNNIIEYVGTKYDGKVDSEIDCNGNLLMPGFINCHAHAPMVLLKGIGENQTLENWLFKNIIPIEEKLTEDDIYKGTILAIREMIKNGITCFQDSYFYPEKTLKACMDTGMRAVISLSQGLSPTKFITLNELEQLYLKVKDKSPLVNFNFYFHSVYTCDENQIAGTIALAKKYNTLIGTHMSETLTEVGDCAKIHDGMTPVQYLDSFGFFDQKCLVAHGVHIQKEDYEILEGKDVSVAHNPSSNLKLGSGIANLKALNNRNINVCLGTDGSASNNKLDMFREMYLSSVLQKGLFNDASIITSNQAIKMATENGAKALGNNKIGTLRKGNFADIIMINLHSVNNQVVNDIKSNLVYACGAEDILMTMINGEMLYVGGKFTKDILNIEK